ncbi:MAG TPA: hypothetical protein VK789_28440 [Bryobacteraceae bacterium]|jgi:hypothetical protein|nr:hypothetical protein [Bryobacteraceae bacterium]
MDNELKEYLDAMEARINANIERVETKLLTAFHGWSRPYEIRARGVSTAVNSFDERLGLVEERLSAIERKQAH